MLITQQGIIDYWLSEPTLQKCKEGDWICLDLGHIPFPDLNEMSSEEKRLFRFLLERHPEYLRYEIFAGRTIQ